MEPTSVTGAAESVKRFSTSRLPTSRERQINGLGSSSQRQAGRTAGGHSRRLPAAAVLLGLLLAMSTSPPLLLPVASAALSSPRSQQAEATEHQQRKLKGLRSLKDVALDALDAIRDHRVGMDQALFNLVSAVQPDVCFSGFVTDQGVQPAVFTGPSMQLRITTGECQVEHSEDGEGAFIVEGSCTEPSIEYETRDGLFQGIAYRPLVAVTPVCRPLTLFGPRPLHAELYVFDSLWPSTPLARHQDVIRGFTEALGRFAAEMRTNKDKFWTEGL